MSLVSSIVFVSNNAQPELLKSTTQFNSRSITFEKESSELSIAKIEEIFQKNFNSEIEVYKETNTRTTTEVSLIKRGISKFSRSSELRLKNRTTFLINFAFNLNPEDAKKFRRTHDLEIGFFNFKVTSYQPAASEKKFTVSYFSEVSFEKPFQSCGLFNVIFNAYHKTLKDLEVDIDYLHVNSQMAFTASLYSNKGYEFTADALANIDERYGSKEEYLKNSSVSYNSDTHIEMFRVLQAGVTMEKSIEQLERRIGS